jgi:hypothetical protein
MPTPGFLTCKNIDDQLSSAGWTVQDCGGKNL